MCSHTSCSAYDADFQRAKALGIDAFALNIGTDFYTDQQLGYAYASAAANDMKVFISFGTTFPYFVPLHYALGTAVGQKIAQYASLDAQLKVDGKVFASSFAGDGVDVNAIRTAAGVDLFWAPNFHPSYGTDFSTIDGALNWMAWPNNGNNKAPTAGANVTVEEGDAEYIAALGSANKYIARSTHFGPEVSYSKNWVFPGDLLWYDRWNEILSLKPRFIEIITWNDYGESHYIGPLNSPHYDDGNSKWTNDMPHDGWMDMAKPFISAFKDGASSANSYVTTDELVYWYRPTPKSINCDATDTTMVTANNNSGNYFEGRPDGYESLSDSVFVVSLLTSPGTITVESGSTVQEFNAPQGISAYEVPMSIGQQQFFLSRNGQTIMSAVSLKDISNVCPCGLYNFNAYVGTVPEAAPDQLQPDGLNSLTAGLHVTTCFATPVFGCIDLAADIDINIDINSQYLHQRYHCYRNHHFYHYSHYSHHYLYYYYIYHHPHNQYQYDYFVHVHLVRGLEITKDCVRSVAILGTAHQGLALAQLMEPKCSLRLRQAQQVHPYQEKTIRIWVSAPMLATMGTVPVLPARPLDTCLDMEK
ncbi:hypothetical protein VMCG_05983 [Cytospora schulzeri]|uniref:Mutanase n=1 Tax=Cytospora schulzeri TaxID=448051 RepID=A0A423WDF5_9PEZI|nr:hypothetical protein VMCG_05983 [Valsa malicola]